MELCELKKQKESKLDALVKECLMFFAFSNDQFQQSKTTLQEGEKYVSLGAGAFLPQGKVQAWKDGVKEIKAWYKEAVKENKLRRANIIHALHNYEATYTGEIEDVMEDLGDDYTAEEVRQVLREIEQ